MARPRAPKICPTPGCPETTPCPHHTPPPWAGSNQRRPNALRGRTLQARNARILTRDGHRCHATHHHPHCDGTATEVDHIVPYSEGGADTDSNLAAINTHCNALKARSEGANHP